MEIKMYLFKNRGKYLAFFINALIALHQYVYTGNYKRKMAIINGLAAYIYELLFYL